MGRLHKERLEGTRIYGCAKCGVHLSKYESIISKQFQGRHGRAYLFSQVVNTYLGPREDRVLMTGLHTVADLFCIVCHESVGWKYLEAFEESQKYKEGRVILEKAKLAKQRWTPSAAGPGDTRSNTRTADSGATTAAAAAV